MEKGFQMNWPMTDGERLSNELTHDWWRKVFKWTDPWLMEKGFQMNWPMTDGEMNWPMTDGEWRNVTLLQEHWTIHFYCINILIDWLVFNANISNISAISCRCINIKYIYTLYVTTIFKCSCTYIFSYLTFKFPFRFQFQRIIKFHKHRLKLEVESL